MASKKPDPKPEVELVSDPLIKSESEHAALSLDAKAEFRAAGGTVTPNPVAPDPVDQEPAE